MRCVRWPFFTEEKHRLSPEGHRRRNSSQQEHVYLFPLTIKTMSLSSEGGAALFTPDRWLEAALIRFAGPRMTWRWSDDAESAPNASQWLFSNRFPEHSAVLRTHQHWRSTTCLKRLNPCERETQWCISCVWRGDEAGYCMIILNY